MLDLATGDESVVCDDPAIQFRHVDIHDDVVVWVDLRNDPTPNNPDIENSDIYARNLLTGEERNLTPEHDLISDKQDNPRVWGHRAFFVANDAQYPAKVNIFMIDLKGIGFVE